MPIQKIPDDSKWKIVSSSFIFSPLSAIKELLDNSLDAGSRNIYIDVDSKTGGCDYFSVRDDAPGVAPEDRKSMCLNHTTSKINSMEDLVNCKSLGFRGEALFMLSTLCNQKGSMEISTRCPDEKIGVKWYTDSNGNVKDNKLSKTACLVGTTITVRKLLHGLRARNMTLSSRGRRNVDEIRQLITHYSILYRAVRFHLTLVSLNKNGSIQQRQLQQSLDTKLSRLRLLANLAKLRKDINDNFILCESDRINDHMELNYILPKMNARLNIVNVRKPFKFFCVNNRALSLSLGLGQSVNRLVNKVYRELKLIDPMVWFIEIKCDPKLVDVNIEPEKNDVLITNIDNMLFEVKRLLTDSVCEAHGLKEEVNEAFTDQREKGNDSTQPVGNNVSEENSDAVTLKPKTEHIQLRPSISEVPRSESKHEETVTTGDGSNKHIQSSITNDQRTSTRAVTSGSMISEEADWDLTMNEESVKGSSISNGEGDVPSSLTYNYKDDSHLQQNEDLELSKDVSVSNPFILHKIKKINKPSPSSSATIESNSVKPTLATSPSIPTKRSRDMDQINPVKKTPTMKQQEITQSQSITIRKNLRKPTAEEVFELRKLKQQAYDFDSREAMFNDTTLADEPQTTSPLSKHRNINMFSEFTNNFQSKMSFSFADEQQDKDSRTLYKKELIWLSRKGSPTLPLVDGVQQKAEQIDNNVDLQLKVSEHGWYIVGL